MKDNLLPQTRVLTIHVKSALKIFDGRYKKYPSTHMAKSLGPLTESSSQAQLPFAPSYILQGTFKNNQIDETIQQCHGYKKSNSVAYLTNFRLTRCIGHQIGPPMLQFVGSKFIIQSNDATCIRSPLQQRIRCTSCLIRCTGYQIEALMC